MANPGNGGGNGGGDKPSAPESPEKTEPQGKPENKRAGWPTVRFIVECATALNSCEIPLDHLRLKLRGRWKRSNVTSQDIGDVTKMPDTPGICIEVNSRDLAIRIFDPLANDDRLMERVNKAFDEIQAIKTGRKMRPWPEAIHVLDDDQFKSVLLEISRKVHDAPDRACMEVVRGEVPTVKELESGDFPGRELYDPWSSSPDKPKYKDQLSEWQDSWRSINRMMAAMANSGVAG